MASIRTQGALRQPKTSNGRNPIPLPSTSATGPRGCSPIDDGFVAEPMQPSVRTASA